MQKETRPLARVVFVWVMRTVTLPFGLYLAFVFFSLISSNWGPYAWFTLGDWVWAWLSVIASLVLALTLWWRVQRFLTRKIYKH
jgi:hypothetical protein